MHKENARRIGNDHTHGNLKSTQAQDYRSSTQSGHSPSRNREWGDFIDTRQEVCLNAKHTSKAERHVKMLVDHLIGWSRDHQASITASVKGLCEGTLTKRTASSLRAILAAYQPETFLVASELLSKVEEHYGPVPDVLASADAVLTRRGFVLNAVFTNGITGSLATGGAA